MLTEETLTNLINTYEIPVMLLPIDFNNFTLSFVCFDSDKDKLEYILKEYIPIEWVLKIIKVPNQIDDIFFFDSLRELHEWLLE